MQTVTMLLALVLAQQMPAGWPADPRLWQALPAVPVAEPTMAPRSRILPIEQRRYLIRQRAAQPAGPSPIRGASQRHRLRADVLLDCTPIPCFLFGTTHLPKSLKGCHCRNHAVSGRRF